MNERPDPDHELEQRLARARDELTARTPRPDPRVEAIFTEPASGIGGPRPHAVDVLPFDSEGAPPGRRERLGVLAAVAATRLDLPLRSGATT